MPLVEERSYAFTRAAHWRAGARRGLEVRGDRLVVPDELVVRPLPGPGPDDAGVLAALDAWGHLRWLRPASRRLVRLLRDDGVVTELGRLDGPDPARRLVAGRSLLWVLADRGLDRYDAATLQRLTAAVLPDGWWPGDAAADGADGVWLTESDRSGRWRLRHLDCWGRTCRDPVTVDGPDGAELAVARVTGVGLVTVDPAGSAALLVVPGDGPGDAAAASGAPIRSVPLDPVHRDGRTVLAAGTAGRVHVLTVAAGREADGVHAVHQVIDVTPGPTCGDVEADDVLAVPRTLGRPTSLLAAEDQLLLVCTGGLAQVVPAPAAATARTATFITPVLVSPVGPRAGWSRAEIDAVLPSGTTAEVSWAATDEVWLADRAERLLAGRSTPGLVEELETLLPWHRPVMTVRGAGDAQERLAALLDGVRETTLWLRVAMQVPAGGAAPALVALRVRYPDTSYLDHLPAIFRSDPHAAGTLREVLAPLEVLLDGLDGLLDTLPGRLDPATATDDWTDYLLGWLGFPSVGELPARVRRGLLREAATLLDLRGTRPGLERLLGIVTEGRARVADSAEQPSGWFLGAGDGPAEGVERGRLGADTVALRRLPAAARAGALVLGEAHLDPACADPPAMLAQRAQALTVTLDVGPDDRRVLEPVVERLLDAFVPVHCRVRLVWTGVPSDRSRRLDVDLRLAGGAPDDADGADHRLHGDVHWRLGATTRLGGWALPDHTARTAALDHRARLDTGPRLQ